MLVRVVSRTSSADAMMGPSNCRSRSIASRRLNPAALNGCLRRVSPKRFSRMLSSAWRNITSQRTPRLPEVPDHIRQSCQVGRAVPRVDADGEIGIEGVLRGRDLADECGEQGSGHVVDAVEAQVLEVVQGHGLA